MRRVILRWAMRAAFTAFTLFIVLLVFVLAPGLLYANKTEQCGHMVFHERLLDASFELRLREANRFVAASEVYNSKLSLDICLNDGSSYPRLMQAIHGPAFAWGFYNKVVLMANANSRENYAELNGYKWNLTQLLAHEMVHCLQYDKRGFWKSNPVAGIDEWKWEGYPEYVARQYPGQKDLVQNIAHLLAVEKTDHNDWILFADSTGTTMPYYKNWLLVQYCMDVKKMSFTQLVDDTMGETSVRRQMYNWYNQHRP